jgi:hypothetical protein
MTKSQSQTLIYILLLILFSFLITGHRIFFCINFFTAPDDFINYNQAKPFVTRVLTIWIAQLIKNISGFKAIDIFAFLEFLAFVFSGYVFSKYINTFFQNLQISRLLSFTLYFIIPFELILPHYQSMWTPYDAYALLFMLCGLLFLHKENFYWYYLFFIIATFNRETTFFLTIIMLFVFWNRMPKKTLALHIFAQFSVWVIIKLFLAWLFIDKPGAVFQHQYFSNINFLTDITWEGYTLRFFEYFFRPAYLIGNFGFIYLLIIAFWKKLDNVFLRRSVFVIIVFYILMLYVGQIYEYRIFSEMIPIILMPSLYIMVKLIKISEINFNSEKTVSD